MLRSLLLSALFATAAMAQPLGGSVLPQNFQQPIASQLTQPVLTSQQAMQLIPNDQLQAQLNARVLQAGQTGVLPPINYHALGVYGNGAQPLVGQQQALAGIGGIQQQQPQWAGQLGLGGVGVQQQPQLGLGAIGMQQQQPFVGGVGIQQQQPLNLAGVGIQQQQPINFGGVGLQQQQPLLGMGVGGIQQQPLVGGVGIQQVQQQPWMQGLNVGAGVLPQQQIGLGGIQQQPLLGMGVGAQQWGVPQQQLGVGMIPQQQLGVGMIPQQQQQQQLGLGVIPQQQGFIQQQPIGLNGVGMQAPQMMRPM